MIGNRPCVFCSAHSDPEGYLNLISVIQGHALSRLLHFEGQGSKVTDPGACPETPKYAGGSPCQRCHELVTEAEAVVTEWELILDKIRTIATRLKDVIQKGSKSRTLPKQSVERFRKLENKIAGLESGITQSTSIGTTPVIGWCLIFLAVYAKFEPIVSSTAENEIETKTEKNFLRPESDSDPEWFPDDEPMSTEPWSELDRKPTRNCQKLTANQKTVLLEQYALHKEVLEGGSGCYDNVVGKVLETWEEVARTVSAAEANCPVDAFTCWKKMSRKIMRDKQKSCGYFEETVTGRVELKHCQVQLVRCDHPTFSYRLKRRRDRPSKPIPLSKYRALMERLRRKTKYQKRTGKKLGRPLTAFKYEIPDGEPQPCAQVGCRYVSADPDQLAGHYREKHLRDPYPYKCSEATCDKKYKEFWKLVVHRMGHAGQFPFHCEHCEMGFQRRDSLKLHIIHKHTENPTMYQCHMCPRSFVVEKNLRLHISYFHTDVRHSCTVGGCSFTCKGLGGLRSHQGRKHPDLFPQNAPRPKEVHMCCECGATFCTKRLYEQHCMSHQGVPIEVIKPSACTYTGCKYRAVSAAEVRKHAKLVHEITGKNHRCTVPECTGKFKSLLTLAMHMKRSHGPKPPVHLFTCDQCGLQLVSQHGLKHHIAIKHTTGNRNDFVCESCQRGFPTRNYLRRHNLSYPNCKPRERGPSAVYCELCDKYVSNMAGLKRHNLLVHDSDYRPFRCDRCSKTFPIKMYLDRHQRDSKVCRALPAETGKISTQPTREISKDEKNSNAPSRQGSCTMIPVSSPLKRRGVPVDKSGKKHFPTPGIEPAQENQIQIPRMSAPPQSQMQQDIYYAYYGFQYQEPNTIKY